MKLKAIFFLPNTLEKFTFKRLFYLFTLLFIFGSLTGVYSQTVSITANQPNANEQGPVNGQYTISVSGAGGITGSVEVFLSLGGASTATSGGDFNALPISVSIGTFFGDGSNTFNLNIIDDDLIETTETVIVQLEPGSYVIGGSGQATINIADNDVAGVNVNPTAGNTTEAGGTATFTFTLTSQPSANVTIPISGYDPNETSGAASVVISPANWNTGVDLVISGVDDPIPIVDGNFVDTINTGDVTSPDPNYDALTGADVEEITVTNLDDDTATLTVEDVQATEGASMQFIVTLNTAVAGGPFDVDVDFNDGTAEGGGPPLAFPDDYNDDTQTLTFNGTAGEQRQFNVQVLTDNVIEGDETFTVELSSDNSLVDDSDTATGTILNDDVGQVTVATDRPTTNEDGSGQSGRFQINLSEPNPTGGQIIVDFTLTGIAIQGVGQDYTITGNASFNPGQDSKNVNINPVDDNLVEGDESVILTVTGVSSSAFEIGTPNSATVTIIDDDIFTATIVATDAAAAENTPATATGTFTIDLGSPNTTGGPIVVTYNITGTATNGTDYTTIAASVSIPNGQQTRTVSIAPIDDLILEGTETVILTLTDSSPDYDLGGPASRTATVNIADNDQANLSIGDIAVNEDVASGNLIFSVTLSAAVTGGTTVGYSFANGTATGGGTDFTANPGTLTFAGTAGEVETITVAINNDQLLEQTETFTVQLGLPSNGVGLSGSGSATGTINDDDNCAAAPILDTSVQTVFCGEEADTGQTPIFQNTTVTSLNDYTNTTPPAGTVLTWSFLSDPLNENAYLTQAQVANPTVEGSYFGFFLDNNGTPNNPNDDCASGVIEVELTLNIVPDAPVGTGNSRCGTGTVLLTASTTSAAASLNWYDVASGGAILGNGPSFTTPSISTTTSFYVEAAENGCFSERVEVVAGVGFQAAAGTPTNASICSVVENGPTILDLDDRLAGEGAGTWVITTDPSGGGVTIQTSNIVDFRDLAAGSYVFTFTTTGSTAPCTNASSTVTITVSACDTDEDGDGLLGGEEAILGTDPDNVDTDGDGIEDGDEVGPDVENPLDEDNDDIIDALDSNILDTDNDGVVDQLDPANGNPCIPNRANGVCDFDGDEITDADEILNGSDPDNPCDPNADSPTCTPIDLEITKEVDNPNAVIGETIVFTITITNPEDRNATNIVVGDLLETGFEFVSFIASAGTYSETTGEWSGFAVEPLSNETLEITVVIVEGSSYSNTAELLSSLPVDDNQDNNTATVQVNIDIPEGIDLVIRKTVDNRAPLVGEQITFTISVENRSQDAAIVSNIQVEDIIPTGPDARFVYVSHVANVGAYDPISGIWIIESLAVGEGNIATLDITVTVPREGIFVNTANILRSSPIDNPENNESFVDVTVSVPTPADPGFLFNQFSPNGDNSNDILRINLTDANTGLNSGITYKIVVYDRYGNLVFEGSDSIPVNVERKADVWDGTYKGKDVPKGTYFYILNYDIGVGPTIDKGWIQLIR